MTKPNLYLTGTKEGGPTPRHIFALYKSLTGLDVPPEEQKEIYAKYQQMLLRKKKVKGRR